MRFSPSLLDEIKARLPVSQVVGRRVRLVKAAKEWKGLSPFNAEKTPSFFVNDQKQAWFDFSSGKNGNIFDFVIESEGVSFPEAVERLAAEAGVPLPARSADAERQEKKRAGLVEVAEMACAYFETVLKGPQGRIAREYLAQRRLTEAARAEFRVGYATSERHALRDHLAGKGVDVATMVEAGLLVSGPDIPVAYDRFRNRVMFPIQDMRARVVAFGGRTLDPEVSAKYLNSPETQLFHKGSLLFNQHRARKAAHEKGRVIAVEGYMDVIAMSEAGFAETVAPLGTALTEEQMTLLWRMADEPILCFDGDKAGQRAAFRAVDLALSHLSPGKSVRFAFLPEGQDPDDLVRGAGAGAVEGVLEVARPLSDVLWAREIAAAPFDTPERRAALERRLREAVARVGDTLARRHYEADIAERLRKIAPGARSPRGVYQGTDRRPTRERPFGSPDRRAWVGSTCVSKRRPWRAPALRARRPSAARAREWRKRLSSCLRSMRGATSSTALPRNCRASQFPIRRHESLLNCFSTITPSRMNPRRSAWRAGPRESMRFGRGSGASFVLETIGSWSRLAPPLSSKPCSGKRSACTISRGRFAASFMTQNARLQERKGLKPRLPG